MPEMQQLADAMLVAAGTVLGRLVDQPATASGTTRHDHDGSILTDGDELITVAQVPSIGAQIIMRFGKGDMQQIVGVMLGGEDLAEMGPMQLSIASETVSQIAVAMVEAMARELDVSTEGIRATLCTDAAQLPPPPFESYDGKVELGGISPKLCVDFAAITLSKLALAIPAQAAPESPARSDAAASAQSVSFTAMQPTPVRPAKSGQADLDLVHDVPLQISAVLGKTVMPLREVVSLQSGTVFELDKLAIDPIDLYVNNILIARGEIVVVDEKYAVKISELNPQAG